MISNLASISFNPLGGAIVAEFENAYTFSAGFPSRQIANFGSDTSNNSRLVIDSAGLIRMASTTGGTTDVNSSDGGGVRSPGIFRTAFAYKENDFAICTNGASPVTDNLALVPPSNQLRLGQSIAGGEHLFGWLRRVAYYPTRLSNTQLQELTS
jgi:hypothetical protein